MKLLVFSLLVLSGNLKLLYISINTAKVAYNSTLIYEHKLQAIKRCSKIWIFSIFMQSFLRKLGEFKISFIST